MGHIINGIDYGDLIFSKRLKIDQLAYTKYYNSFFMENIEIVDDNLIVEIECIDSPLTYNQWYGTDLHRQYANMILRKKKLEKINKNIKK